MVDTPVKLYRALLREAQKFPTYNYREYAQRRIREEFKEMDTSYLERGQAELAQLKRLVKVAKLYVPEGERLVIEQ